MIHLQRFGVTHKNVFPDHKLKWLLLGSDLKWWRIYDKSKVGGCKRAGVRKTPTLTSGCILNCEGTDDNCADDDLEGSLKKRKKKRLKNKQLCWKSRWGAYLTNVFTGPLQLKRGQRMLPLLTWQTLWKDWLQWQRHWKSVALIQKGTRKVFFYAQLQPSSNRLLPPWIFP